MIYLGIDPGLDGALAVMSRIGVTLHDTPTLTVASKTGTRREYDLSAMRRLLLLPSGEEFDWVMGAAIERVHAMPCQGVRSMFTLGFGLGVWEGLLAGLGIPYERVTPQRWQKAMLDGMGRDKDASRLRAIQLFPSVADQLARKKDHGRADALLIAEWRRRQG